MIQETSLEAYMEVLKTLSDKQRIVYRAWKKMGNDGACNLGIAGWLHWPINSVTPRALELRQKGLLEYIGKREVNGRNANFFRTVEPPPIPTTLF